MKISSRILTKLFFLIALFTVNVAHAGIVHVSNDVSAATSSTSIINLTVNSVAANDLMVIGVSYCCNTSAPIVSDNQGNTWYLLKKVSDYANDTIALYYSIATIGGVTQVKVKPNTEQYMAVTFSEYSGVNATYPLDGAAAGQLVANTYTADSGAVTPSQFGDLLVTIGYNDQNAAHSPGSGFTALSEISTPMAIAAEYQVYNSTSPVHGLVVFTTCYTVPAIMQAFNPSGSAPPTTTTTTSTTSTTTTSTTTLPPTTTTTTLPPTTTTTTTLPPTTTTTTLPPPTTTTTSTTTTSTTTTTLPPPALGAHAMAYISCDSSGPLQTAAMNTAVSGSTILVWTARGVGSDVSNANRPQSSITANGAPIQIGSTQNYAPTWKDSAEALYAWPNYVGGIGNIINFPLPHQDDEVSTIAVEVLNGGNIASYSFGKIISGAHTSGTVTTTGPATLVAIWAGDAGANTSDAVPNNGFTVIESQYHGNCSIEVTAATKDVPGAGTYNVSWSPNVPQGAHLWLVAVQRQFPIQKKISSRASTRKK